MNRVTGPLDLESLCEPVAGDMPCGRDLRTDISPESDYYQLRDLRSRARAAERNALIEDSDIRGCMNDWRPMFERIPPLLITATKDLELVAWLIEALCRLYGFTGLAQGFLLAHRLIEDWWAFLYPMPEDGELDVRLAPLLGLNGVDSEGALLLPIASIAVTDAPDAQYATWQFEQASDISRLDELKQKARLASGGASLKEIQAAAALTSPSFFNRQVRALHEAQQAFALLSASMDKAMGGVPQPASHIARKLDACMSALRFLGADKLSAIDIDTVASVDAVAAGIPDTDSVPGVPTTRIQALDQLKTVARFFRQTEPHSPISYAIEQAVRWSDMPLPQLLAELISDNDARKGYCRLAGIPVE